ncbi:hypothetical protein [Clostridium sp. Marseille-Q2269]|uniref:hypothetical protein n=1 Tax=Clostridium sp. Marseille-Q2269 TaxID=2942205 RepID=UPI0020730333|nr:hypothetical protein [Clostridium sp. Marseille-Q2269]
MTSLKRDCIVTAIVWLLILLTLPYEAKIKYVGYSLIGIIIIFVTQKLRGNNE